MISNKKLCQLWNVFLPLATVFILGISIALPYLRAYAFETLDTGVVTVENSGRLGKVLASTAGHIGTDIHQEITRSAFPFLKASIVSDINRGQEFADFRVDNQLNPAFHFDGCAFTESTTNINDHYDSILGFINGDTDPSTPHAPNQLQGSQEFGEALHTAQDFYAHSNWIELQNLGFVSKSKAVDEGLDKWTILSSGLIVPGTKVIVIEGSKPNPTAADPSLNRNGHIVTKGDTPGLISGIAFEDGSCPRNIALGHYDPIFFRFTDRMFDVGKFPIDKIPKAALTVLSPSLTTHEGVTGLNKDNAARAGTSFGTTSTSGFPDAKRMAIKQTTHEWCRLVNLEKTVNGPNAVKKLFAAWVQDKDVAISTCPGITDLKEIVESTTPECRVGDTGTKTLVDSKTCIPPTPPTPSGDEICGDFIDNNGNGEIDEGCSIIPPTPSTTTECDPKAKTISKAKGSEGPLVERLQKLLVERGFDPGPIDGKFGSLTEKAVKQFQEANSLDVDGIVGPQTWGKLCELSSAPTPPPVAPSTDSILPPGTIESLAPLLEPSTSPSESSPEGAESTPPPPTDIQPPPGIAESLAPLLKPLTPAQTSTTGCDPNAATVQNGSTGPTVQTLQTLLTQLGFDPGPVDGIFGGGTAEAVKQFQGANSLDADGIVGPQTWGKLCELSSAPTPPPVGGETTTTETSPPPQLTDNQPSTGTEPSTSPPESSPEGAETTTTTPPPADVQPSTGTEESSLAPLSESSTSPTPSTTGCDPNAATVQNGSTGPTVQTLQTALTQLGFDPGPVDGIFGGGTEEAVKQFQQANNLDADGIVGPNTWSALCGMIGTP